MTSSSASSLFSGLLSGAPLLLALALPLGCEHSAPPATEPVSQPAAARATARSSDKLVVNSDLSLTAPSLSTQMNAPTGHQASTPARASRQPVRRDASLASPPIVVGTVDRGDLSETLAEPAPSIIDQTEIDQMFESHSDELQKCYRSQRAPSGSEIVVGFVIGADGRMASVWPVATQVNSVRVTQCVLKTVGAFTFHATPGGTTRATSTIRYE